MAKAVLAELPLSVLCESCLTNEPRVTGVMLLWLTCNHQPLTLKQACVSVHAEECLSQGSVHGLHV